MTVVAAFTFAVPAQAQFQMGVKAGLNVDKVDLKNVDENINENNRTGFFVGITADFKVPIIGIGADISLLYDNKVVGVTKESEDANKTLHYLDIPINIKYTFGFSSLLSLYAATGPQFSFNVGDRSWSPSVLANYTKDWELRKSEFSWNVGAGITVKSHVRIGYNYNMAIGKTADVTITNLAGDVVKGKLKNNTHQIFLAYMF